MVKSIQCFEDAKGGIHKDAYAAHRADLAIWLEASGLANPGTAAGLAGMMVKRSNAITLVEMLQEALNHAPDDQPVATYPGDQPVIGRTVADAVKYSVGRSL